jgi:hypothetical protein
MKTKSIYRHIQLTFVLFLIGSFFIYRFNQISYGLPFFINLDEINFQGSTLSSLGFLTGYFERNVNPFYAPLINLIIILKSIFINEFLFNSLTNLDQIKNKLYFNPELFLFYGRIANLTITSISIFILYLIFKKFKINFIIYSILLITFSTSLVALNVSTIMGKNSSYLLVYLIQLYFLIKYLCKIEKFNLKSYFVFGLLASLAWGVNYWPAFISIYAVFFLHFKKLRFSKINYLFIFLITFFLFGPLANSFFVSKQPFAFMALTDDSMQFDIGLFLNSFINDVIKSFTIIYTSEKNIILLCLITPFFLLNKYTKFKKEYLIILFLIFEPIFLFSISDNIIPQLRYFAGVNCVILILTGLIFNELHKTKLKYLGVILLISNFLFIYMNIKLDNNINKIVSKNHSFYDFNKNIKKDRSKILYLVNLDFQETLKQNLYYLKIYDKNLIKKSNDTEKFLQNIEKKIQKIRNTKNIIITNQNIKKDITYFNYSYFPPIDDLRSFFNFIKNDFEYIVIEDSTPFYLADRNLHKKIRSYVKENFILDHIQYEEEKIFLRSQETVIHYFSNSLIPNEFAKNINNDKLEIIYGTNFSLYKLK